MPAITFHEYAETIKQVLDTVIDSNEVVRAEISEDRRSSLRGCIAGMLQFSNDSELYFREYVDASLSEPRLTYAYHFQNSDHELIFRYDNAPHRPPLEQAEHKHTPAGVQVHPAPTLAQVINEIMKDR